MEKIVIKKSLNINLNMVFVTNKTMLHNEKKNFKFNLKLSNKMSYLTLPKNKLLHKIAIVIFSVY